MRASSASARRQAEEFVHRRRCRRARFAECAIPAATVWALIAVNNHRKKCKLESRLWGDRELVEWGARWSVLQVKRKDSRTWHVLQAVVEPWVAARVAECWEFFSPRPRRPRPAAR